MKAQATPALLLMAEYNCTLAAARCLAEYGTPVVIGTSSVLAPTRWSNAVREVIRSPDFNVGPARLAEWLRTYGDSHEKAVLYPTCDEMAWLIAHHRQALEPVFHLYSPDATTLDTILDKRLLNVAAEKVGLRVPRTWYAQREDELESILTEVPACVVKPRSSQVFSKSRAKGGVAHDGARLKRLWRYYRAATYADEVVRTIDDVHVPMVQEYLPQAATEVFSISGFAIRGGRIIACRGSRKLFQVPRQNGVGLCFEASDPPRQLVELLEQLCASTGYFGVFEAEFVRHEGQALLIDFNPRYFGQIGFDVARGLPLPWLAQLCAVGGEDEAVRVAAAPTSNGPTRFADSRALRWHLAASDWLGRMPAGERERWQSWLEVPPDQIVDAVLAPQDRAPARAAALRRFWEMIRYPRGFWRNARERSTSGSTGMRTWPTALYHGAWLESLSCAILSFFS